MKQLIIASICILLFSINSFASKSTELENRLVENLAKAIFKVKSPKEAVDKLEHRLKPEEVTYLRDLIKQKKWTEVPTTTFEGNTINFRFSHDLAMELEVVDYWKGEFKLNGYKLETKRYNTLTDQIAYLNRVVQKQFKSKKQKTSGLFGLIIPEAQADLGCNALIEASCIEVSMAAAMWFAREVAADSPIATCMVATNIVSIKKCLEQYNNNETISTIHEISEILALAPASIDISMECKTDRLANLWIGDTLVAGYENKSGTTISDLGEKQNPQGVLNKLPELANRCCTKKEDDVFSGRCEEFVHEHLGAPDKRQQEYNKPNIRLKGKPLPGVK